MHEKAFCANQPAQVVVLYFLGVDMKFAIVIPRTELFTYETLRLIVLVKPNN